MHVVFPPEVVSYLADAGFDPVYGARPLRRAIVRRVEDPLSEELLRGTIHSGDTVEAALSDGTIVFRSIASPAPVDENTRIDVAEAAGAAAE